MNELELLSRYGQVGPVEDRLIDATIEALFDQVDQREFLSQMRRGGRRRSWRAMALAGVTVAAVTATITALTLTGRIGEPRHPVPRANVTHGAELASVVVHRSLTALGNARSYVEHVTTHDVRGTVTSWVGPNRILAENPGKTASLEAWAPDGSSTILTIDYQHGTWYKAAGSPPQTVQSGVDASAGAELSANSIAAWFRQTGATVLGTATVNGTSTYEVRLKTTDASGNPTPSETVTAWVDSSTYLPVHMVREAPAVQAWNNRVRVTIPAFTATDDFTWQPANPQSMSVFSLTPPTGFRQIAPPTGR